jgi:Rod binding domain-containing protein
MDGGSLSTFAMDARLADLSSTARLDAATGAADVAEDGFVLEAADEFEALLATTLVREMRKGLPDGFFGKGPGADVFEGWLDEHVGGSLAESGALDLAGIIKVNLGTKQSDKDAHQEQKQ